MVPGMASLIPWGLSILALTSLYMLVPNCKVPWKHALIAAVLVATVFELAKFLFGRIMGMFPSYQLIYGAFAAVPLFLVWMYLGWMLLILGAEISFSLSHQQQKTGQSEPLALRLKMIALLLEAQHQKRAFDQLQLEQQLWQEDLELIEQFTALAEQKSWLKVSQEGELLWVCDPQQISLAELVADLNLGQLQVLTTEDSDLNLWRKNLIQSMENSLNHSVAGLIKGNVAKMPQNFKDN